MEGYPKRGELVVATVDRVVDSGAYVSLDEYSGKQGMVHIREFSLKWVKNPRNYLKEGQKSVLQVLRVDPGRGHIDLSLKNVNDNEKRNKIKAFKLGKRADKLVTHLAHLLSQKTEELRAMFVDRLSEDYGGLYNGFLAVSKEEEDLKDYIKDEKTRKTVLEAILQAIKPPTVTIEGFLLVSSEASDGIKKIKGTLEAGLKPFDDEVTCEITCLSAPNYRMMVMAEDYKNAEEYLKKAIDSMEEYSKSNDCTFKFSREQIKE